MPDISEENKDVILRFKDYLLSEGIGAAKIDRYLSDCIKYSRILRKPFGKATKEDVRKVVAEIEQSELAAETKKGFKILLRKLYRFIRGVEKKGEYPDEVKWISIHIGENHRKLPEELLSAEEIWRIVQKCETVRDRALIAALAESGCRISEIGTMQIKHVSFEEHGSRLTVNGKTGMRKILVINSTPYLREWLNHHPFNTNSESYLWIKDTGKMLSYTRISAILKDAASKAGIQKRVHPHLFRHSRATVLASIMSDASLKHYFGWMQGSQMASIYIHMSGKETDEAILKVNGISVKKDSEKSILEPKKCLRCNSVNEATNICCKMCGMFLDKNQQNEILKHDFKRSQMDEMMNELVKDSEFLAFLLKKIQEKTGQGHLIHS